eukprot:gene17377-biopygen17327
MSSPAPGKPALVLPWVDVFAWRCGDNGDAAAPVGDPPAPNTRRAGDVGDPPEPLVWAAAPDHWSLATCWEHLCGSPEVWFRRCWPVGMFEQLFGGYMALSCSKYPGCPKLLFLPRSCHSEELPYDRRVFFRK